MGVVVVLALLGVASVAVLSSSALQRRLVFFPEHLDDEVTFAFALPHTEVIFVSPTGHRLHAVRIVPAGDVEPDRAILYLHGNAGSVASWGHVGAELAAHDAIVYVVDYAGFGKSTGRLTEASLLQDVDAVYDAVAAQHRDVIVFGRSIGSGPAVHLAATRQPVLLLLETPYASLTDVVHRMLPWVPAAMLAFSLHSDHWLDSVHCPIHVFHGTADAVIPLASAKRLLADRALPAGSTVTIVDGGGHNDLADFASYRDALARALAR